MTLLAYRTILYLDIIISSINFLQMFWRSASHLLRSFEHKVLLVGSFLKCLNFAGLSQANGRDRNILEPFFRATVPRIMKKTMASRLFFFLQ